MDFNTRAKGPRRVQKGPKTVYEDFSTRPKGPRRVQKGPKKTVGSFHIGVGSSSLKGSRSPAACR